MKMLVVTYRDKDLSQFKAPMAINCSEEKDFVRDVTAGLLKAYPAATANKFIGQELYIVGEYNDQSGTIEGLIEPKMLLDCDVLLAKRKELAQKAKELEVQDA